MGGGQDAQATVTPGGEDNQGGGEDAPGNFNPRGSSCPRVSWPPGVKLPRGQDKPVHRQYLFINYFLYETCI